MCALRPAVGRKGKNQGQKTSSGCNQRNLLDERVTMFSSHNYVYFLRMALLGIGILFATVNVERVLAAGIQKNGDYDDGELTWSKMSGSMDYGRAVEFCDGRSGGEGEWEVPTSQQMKLFYQHIHSRPHLKDELKTLYGWNFNWAWTSTKVPNTNRHETIFFSPGILQMGGMKDSEPQTVTCVRSNAKNFIDGRLTWSPFDPTAKNFEEAQQHCAKMGSGWKLPVPEQLHSFAQNAAPKTNIVGEYRKAAYSAPLWTLNGSLFNLLGTQFNKSKDENYYVMCVKG